MTKEQLWRLITDRNPHFLTGERPIRFTPESLRKLYDLVWDQAVIEETDGELPDFMRGLFGRGK
jgi:hypothetical protein